MLRPLLLAALLLTACAASEGPPQLLTSLEIRSRLFGHMMEATDAEGRRYFIRFRGGSRAEIIGDTSEFARWYTDSEHGLCLKLHDSPPRCAPFYQINVAHFQWGDTRLSDLTVRRPDFDHEFGRKHMFPEHLFPEH